MEHSRRRIVLAADRVVRLHGVMGTSVGERHGSDMEHHTDPERNAVRSDERRIDEAIARLAEGAYGACVECDAEISEGRLQAVPFAVRCQACEARREQVVAPERALRAASRWSYREAVGM